MPAVAAADILMTKSNKMCDLGHAYPLYHTFFVITRKVGKIWEEETQTDTDP